MNLADRLVAAANGDVEWRRRLLLEAVEAIKTPAVEWLEQAGPIAAELNERVRDGGSACSANPKGLEHE